MLGFCLFCWFIFCLFLYLYLDDLFLVNIKLYDCDSSTKSASICWTFWSDSCRLVLIPSLRLMKLTKIWMTSRCRRRIPTNSSRSFAGCPNSSFGKIFFWVNAFQCMFKKLTCIGDLFFFFFPKGFRLSKQPLFRSSSLFSRSSMFLSTIRFCWCDSILFFKGLRFDIYFPIWGSIFSFDFECDDVTYDNTKLKMFLFSSSFFRFLFI